MLNELEKKILAAVQDGLPMTLTPYADLAAKIGISTEQLLAVLKTWKYEGKLRRVGAIVNHFQMGRSVGALVAWEVPAGNIDRLGELFASFSEVSHAYQRPTSAGWPYSLYTMVHGDSDDALRLTITAMRQASGITAFRELKTVRELKKTAPVYI
jgi:DNA-binding Lrp family transcriptional regulator